MKQKKAIGNLLKDNMMVILLIALLAAFGILCPIFTGRSFISLSNLMNVLGQNAYLFIIGVGITFIMLGGAMDLSTGFILSTVGIVMALADGKFGSFILTFIIGVGLSIVLSGFNGVMYSWLKVFPFIITLGMQYCLNGASYLLSGGMTRTYQGLSGWFKILGGYNIKFIGGSYLKSGVIVAIIMVAIGSFILNKTYFGRNVYALGSNPDAVALSGVSVAKMRIAIFALAGFFFGVAQVVNIGKIGAVNNSMGIGAEFTVMAGAMLGGIKMGGGGGKMSNMVIGVLIIAVLNSGMNFLNINQYWQYVALGVVLLFAVSFDVMQTRSAEKAAKKVTGAAPVPAAENKAE